MQSISTIGLDIACPRTEEAHGLLSAPDSKSGRLQRECLKLLREHERNGDIPTNGRFPFYELEQRGVIPKKYDGVNPRTGKNYARTPLQDVSVCDHAFARGWPRAVALDRGRDPQPVVMELCRQRRRLCQGRN